MCQVHGLENVDLQTLSTFAQVMIAMDGGPESWYAVKWGIENVVRFGDNVLILYVGPKEEETGDYSAKALLWEKGGTPFIPLMEFGSLAVRLRGLFMITNDRLHQTF